MITYHFQLPLSCLGISWLHYKVCTTNHVFVILFQPGKRALLLKDMMLGQKSEKDEDSADDGPITHKAAPKSASQRNPGQTLKRKYLSPAQQRIADRQRLEAIALYRNVRDQKYSKNNTLQNVFD